MIIEVNNIQKKFGKKQVLKGIDFSAAGGECVGILGGNGSGKSTLFSILAGVQKCDCGSFLCDGKDLFKEKKLHKSTIGYVPQGTPLLEELSARDNLLLWYEKEDMERELEGGVLRMLGVHEFIKTTVSKMSGGMRKRLSIGCAVAQKQPVILLDEPSAALDLACKENIAEYLKLHKSKGGILLLATHDVLELELCDKYFIIKDGVLVPFEYDGNVSKLVESL